MAAFPIDLVLVRHGESEANLAQSLSKVGDDRLWTAEFAKRHTSRYRLTDRGRKQSLAAGQWIREHVDSTFDAYFTSEYTRAMETAAFLGFENAQWAVGFYLRERDRGVLGGTSKTQRKRDHSQLVEKQLQNPFYFAAPGGESIANACLRVEQFLQELRENCAGQRVVVVCHGNIIEGFKVRLEGMTGFQYRQWLEDRKDEVRLCVHNCQVVHYSRRNPYTGHIHGRFRWCRSVCPWDPSLSYGTWTPVVEPKFSNEDMLKEVNKVKQLVNNKLAEELQRTTQAATLQRSTSKCGKADTPGVIPPLTKSSSKAKATVIAVDPAPQRKEKEGALTPRILSMPDGAMSPRTTRASDTRASDGPDAKRAKFGHV